MPQKPPIQKLDPNQYVDRKVSDGQIDLIGRVVVLFSKLEAALEDTIWYFLKIDDEDGKIVTKRLDAETKIQMVRALAIRHLADKKILSKLKEILVLISELKDNRNFIVHGLWGTMMPDNVPVALSLRPKAEPGVVVSETFPPERMKAISDGISVTTQKLVDLPVVLGASRRVPQ